MADQKLWLNPDEIMLLTDRVRNDDRNTEDQSVCAYELLLKLGSLYVEAVGSGTPISTELVVAVSESECWLLRSKVQSGDKTARDALFGVKLLTKLYRALLAFQINLTVWPDSDSDGVDLTEDMRRALLRRAER